MKIIDIRKVGTGNVFAWTKDYLFQYLTQSKNAPVKSPKLIAAFNYVDRADFVPAEVKNRAYEDSELNIGNNEDLTRPSIIAQMLELLNPKEGGKYLDIGTGSGYFANLLGFAIGSEGRVYTIERVQWLWEKARKSATKYKDIKNINYLYRDGMEGLAGQAPFDGIHISFAVKDIPDNLKMQLKPEGGRLVVPTVDMDLRVIERNGEDFTEEIIPGFVFKEGKAGVA